MTMVTKYLKGCYVGEGENLAPHCFQGSMGKNLEKYIPGSTRKYFLVIITLRQWERLP